MSGLGAVLGGGVLGGALGDMMGGGGLGGMISSGLGGIGSAAGGIMSGLGGLLGGGGLGGGGPFFNPTPSLPSLPSFDIPPMHDNPWIISDKRMKTDVRSMSGALDRLLAL